MNLIVKSNPKPQHRLRLYLDAEVENFSELDDTDFIRLLGNGREIEIEILDVSHDKKTLLVRVASLLY